MELAWVLAAAFPAERQRGSTGASDRGHVAQRIGGVGSDVQQDKVGHAPYVVSSCEKTDVVFGGALPLHGGK